MVLWLWVLGAEDVSKQPVRKHQLPRASPPSPSASFHLQDFIMCRPLAGLSLILHPNCVLQTHAMFSCWTSSPDTLPLWRKTGELCGQLIKGKERKLDDNSDPDVKKIIVEEINTQLVDLRLGSVAQTWGWLAGVCVWYHLLISQWAA